jgi:hypothetical protein
VDQSEKSRVTTTLSIRAPTNSTPAFNQLRSSTRSINPA